MKNAKDFFEQMAKPAYQQFSDGHPNFLKVFAMANSLFNMSEWVFHYNKSQAQAKFGMRFESGGHLWKAVVQKEVVDAGLIRDVANSSKHAILAQKPSTGVRSAEDTGITTSIFAPGIFDSGIFQTTSRVLIQDGKRQVPLEPIAEAILHFWQKLVDEFHSS